MSKLANAKHEFFCLEYLKDLNATRAYREVYQCTAAMANKSGPRLLVNVGISKRIDQLKLEREKRVVVEGDDVLRELKHLGHSDLRALFDDDGLLLPVKDWPEELARAVSSIEVEEIIEDIGYGNTCRNCKKQFAKDLVGYTKKVKFWDKPKSLELLGKHKKLFTDKLEVKDTTNRAERLAAIRARLGKK